METLGRRPLDVAVLGACAEEATGLSNWGSDDTFRIGLEKLIGAVECEAYAEQIRPAAAAWLVNNLMIRLRLEEDARQHPAILTYPIERPLILTGLPRSGTTWLFELLALDPAVRAPLDWEIYSPWPAPEKATFETDPRIAKAQARYDAMLEAAPELATMHHYGAQLPQECNAIMTYHFASSNYWARFCVPEYLEWLSSEQQLGAFNTHKRVLQQLQWRGPRGRWTLKSPPHLLMIPELLEAYPDAVVIQTHREPQRIVASLADLIRTRRRLEFPDIPELYDPKAEARAVMLHFGTAIERATKSRADPQVDKHFIDIAYRETVADPIGTVRRIYDHARLPFTPEYERRLVEHMNAPRTGGHGKHHYDMSEFGIAELDLINRFPSYRARFGDLLPEKRG